MFTIGWMLVEAAVSLWSAWRARGPELWPLVETVPSNSFRLVLCSGDSVPLRTRQRRERRPKSPVLCYLCWLPFVAVASTVSLLRYSEPGPSLLGIAILILAAVVMPWLAKEKRRLSPATGSAALRADATESATCAYLSVIALLSVAINALWHFRWADPIAAIAILPIIVWEGREAVRGKACNC